jgi:hypothetical protein
MGGGGGLAKSRQTPTGYKDQGFHYYGRAAKLDRFAKLRFITLRDLRFFLHFFNSLRFLKNYFFLGHQNLEIGPSQEKRFDVHLTRISSGSFQGKGSKAYLGVFWTSLAARG